MSETDSPVVSSQGVEFDASVSASEKKCVSPDASGTFSTIDVTGHCRCRVLDIRSIDGSGGGADKILLRTAMVGGKYGLDSTIAAIYGAADDSFDLLERGRAAGVSVVPIPQRFPFDPTVYRKLKHLVKNDDFDLVHSHDYKSSFYALRLKREFGIPAIYTAHGWTGNLLRERYLYYPMEKYLLRHFDVAIGVSSELHRELLRCRLPASRVFTLLNGIDHLAYIPDNHVRREVRSELDILDEHIVIGSVGRVEKQKRFDLLLHAFTSLLAKLPNLRLLIAGTGSLLDEIRKQAEELGVADSCCILGHVTDMRRLYQSFDLFAQSSEYEGTPTVLVEAMAMGIPIVATDVGGTSELLVDRKEALLVPPHDVPALAGSIEQAITETESAQARAISARSKVENELSIHSRTRKLVDIYREVMPQGHGVDEELGRASRTHAADHTDLEQSPDSSSDREAINICFLIDDLRTGGTEKQLLQLIENLDRNQFQPHLCILDGTSATSQGLEPPDCPVLRLGLKRLLSKKSWKCGKQFMRFLRENQIEILQVHFPDSTYFGVPFAKLAGVPCVVRTRRDLFYWVTPTHLRLGKHVDSLFNFLAVDAMLANSESVKKSAMAQEWHAPRHIRVIPNALDRSVYSTVSPSELHSGRRVGMVAMFRPEKRLDLFLEAASQVIKQDPESHFALAGDGPMRAMVDRIIHQEGLHDHVELCGAVESVPRFLRGLNCAVLCSDTEGMSNALIEYMASGLPVVATSVGGNRELIQHRENGLLVPPNDAAALAEAIQVILDDPELRLRLGDNARHTIAKKFDLPLVVKKHERFYQALRRFKQSTGGR